MHFTNTFKNDMICLKDKHLEMPVIVLIYCYTCENIRICHECEDGIEKSVPRITDWNYEACRVMTKGDHKGRIFLSHPHMNNGFFFLLTN